MVTVDVTLAVRDGTGGTSDRYVLFTTAGDPANNQSNTVEGIGDVNGDGSDDMVVGA